MIFFFRNCLQRTFRQCALILEFVRSKGVEVRFHGRGKNEATHYCGQCELEVFNILFIREQEKRHVVHCMGCARKQAPGLDGFVCLEQYTMPELMQVYDNFTIGTNAVSILFNNMLLFNLVLVCLSVYLS